MKPGASVSPRASITRSVAMECPPPIDSIVPSTIRTSARRAGVPVPSRTITLVMTTVCARADGAKASTAPAVTSVRMCMIEMIRLGRALSRELPQQCWSSALREVAPERLLAGFLHDRDGLQLRVGALIRSQDVHRWRLEHQDRRDPPASRATWRTALPVLPSVDVHAARTAYCSAGPASAPPPAPKGHSRLRSPSPSTGLAQCPAGVTKTASFDMI